MDKLDTESLQSAMQHWTISGVLVVFFLIKKKNASNVTDLTQKNRQLITNLDLPINLIPGMFLDSERKQEYLKKTHASIWRTSHRKAWLACGFKPGPFLL